MKIRVSYALLLCCFPGAKTPQYHQDSIGYGPVLSQALLFFFLSAAHLWCEKLVGGEFNLRGMRRKAVIFREAEKLFPFSLTPLGIWNSRKIKRLANGKVLLKGSMQAESIPLDTVPNVTLVFNPAPLSSSAGCAELLIQLGTSAQWKLSENTQLKHPGFNKPRRKSATIWTTN